MAEPTAYDEIQDGRLDSLESLITAEYQPPAGTEYSFPVANQGITQEQFRLMHLGQANGIIHGDNGVVNDNPNSTGWRYYLDNHESDAETNQRNTKILRAGTSAESIVEGFYHRLTEDMELPFPPVTTTTVYHVTITYDPRDFKTNPVRIQVYPGEPPTSQGRVHLLLYTVERQPNQLLTQATVTRYRPYTAGLLSVQNRNQLPDPGQYPAGTVVIPSADGHGIYVRRNGALEWVNPLAGTWRPVQRIGSAWETQSERPLRARTVPGGCTLAGVIQPTTGSSGTLSNGVRVFDLPTGIVPPFAVDFEVVANSAAIRVRFRANEDGTVTALGGVTERIGWLSFNAFIPID